MKTKTSMREDGFYLELRKAGNVDGEAKERPDKELGSIGAICLLPVLSSWNSGFIPINEKSQPFPEGRFSFCATIENNVGA